MPTEMPLNEPGPSGYTPYPTPPANEPPGGPPLCGLPHGPDEWCGRPATVAYAARVGEPDDLTRQRPGVVLVCEEMSRRLEGVICPDGERCDRGCGHQCSRLIEEEAAR